MLPALPPVAASQQRTPVAWATAVVFASLLLGNNLFTKITLLLCLIYFGFANRRVLPEIVVSLRHAPGLVLFELWAVASVLWSVVPAVTLDIVMTQSAFFCLCVLMAREASERDLVTGFKLAAYFVISMVVLYALAFPAAAISPNGFKAFYETKNGLGLVSALCIAILLYGGHRKWFDWAMIAVAMALLALSHSKTSMIVTSVIALFTLMLLPVRSGWRQMDDFPRELGHLIGRGVPSLFYALIGIGIVFRESIADYLIRAIPYDFLTGRGELWVMVLRRTGLDLLRGIGPGAFWAAGPQSEVAQTALLAKYPGWVDRLGSADGGYIDLIGSLGFIGLGLLLVSVVNNYRRFFRVAGIEVKANANASAAPMLLALISFFFLHNVTETTVYQSTNSLWFIYLFASFSLVFMDTKQKIAATGSTRAFEIPDSRYSENYPSTALFDHQPPHDSSSPQQPAL